MATDKELLDLAEKAVPGATPTKDAELEQLAEAATPNGATPLGAREEPAPAAAVAELPQVDQPIAETPAAAAQPAPQPIAPAAPAPPPGPPPLPGGGRPSMASAGAAIDQAAQAGFDKAAAQADVGKAKGAALEGAATQADKETALRRQQAVELDAMTRAQVEAQQRAQAEAHDAERSFRDFKLHDYFKSQTAGEQLRANIFIGLGAAGQALAGGDNPALEKLKMIVDQDFKVQQLDLQKRERFAELKQKGATNLATQFQHDLGLLKLKQAAALDAVAAEAKAQAIRNGMPVEAAENNVIVAGTKQAALEKRAEGQQHLQSSAATQAMAGAHLALARETAEGNRDAKKAAASDKATEKADETEVLDYDGNPIGHTSGGRSGQAAATEAKKRLGNAKALVAQIDSTIESLNRDGKVVGLAGVGTEAYKERIRLLAGVQSKARVFSELPSSEGGLHLEHQQIGSANTASAEQLAALRDDIIKQTNLKNQALVTKRSAGGGQADGPAKPVDKRALAKEAMLDPDAPPEVKARAREILLARP